MALSNRDRIGKALEQLRDGLVPFLERELKQHAGAEWQAMAGRAEQRGDKLHWDNQALLKTMVETWHSVFQQTLGHPGRSLVGELIDIRNRWAHDEAFTSDDTYRGLDTIHRLLVAVSAGAQAKEVDTQRQELMRVVFAEQARNKARYSVTVEGKPAEGLRPWREIVTPHGDVASGRYLQAEFAADLAQVYRGEGSDEYRDPVEFFRRTFITDGLRDLLDAALRRLGGKDGDPVVELQTNFGGGKTHSMLALYHLFGGTPSASLPGVEAVLKGAGVERAVKANRAVLVGTALSPGEVSKKPDGTKVRTLWGEMAWQLGGKEAYKLVADSDANGTSPGSQTLRELFQKYSPCLVLIDEWVAYARQLFGKTDIPAGDFDAQSTFAQAITEAAKAAPGTLVVASIPASKMEIGGDNGQHALETLKNVFKRVAKPWRPASADEGFEIVRRRLFEPITDKSRFAQRDAVVDAFAKLYRDGAGDYPPGCNEGSYRRKLESAYPIHPEMFDRLYGEWSTLDKFQRTRGVLRLLARVIHRLWEGQDGGLLILPSSVPLDDPAVKSEVTQFLDDNWEPIISKDVDGPDSLPLDLDRSTPNLGRYSACRRVARTLYIGTAPGAKGKNPGIDDRQVRLGCTQPGETAATFGDALRRLTDRGTYLYVDGNRYWFSTQPSVARLADDRGNQLDVEDVHAEIVARLHKERERGDFAGLHVCPESSGDVPDEMGGRLVLLGPKQYHRRDDVGSPAFVAARELMANRGSSPRLCRNTLVFLAPDKQRLDELEAATRQYLAWKSIHAQEEELNLDAFQRKQAKTKMETADETIVLRIREAWMHVLVPSQPDAKGEVTWEVLKVSGKEPLAKRASIKLVGDELLMPKMGGVRLRMVLDKYLWSGQDHLAFGQLCDYFARYVYLPRVVSKDTLSGAVQDGAAQIAVEDTFAVAAGYDEKSKRYLGLKIGSAIPVDSTTLVVKPEVAKRQRAEVEAKESKVGDPPVTNRRADGRGASPEDKPVQAAPPSPPKVFVGSVMLDDTRIGRDAGRIAEEVIQHLSTLPGAEVRVSLEIHVEVPGGIGDNVQRTVRENATTLKFKAAQFERG